MNVKDTKRMVGFSRGANARTESGLFALVLALWPAGCGDVQQKRVGEGAGEAAQNLTADDCKQGYNCASPTWTFVPSPQVPAQQGTDDYCKDVKCGKGEGDCDSDTECKADHVCVYNRGAFVGQPVGVDICWPTVDVCNDLGPCRDGEGDCDVSPGRQGPRECVEGTICQESGTVDVCKTRAPDDLNARLAGYSVPAPGFAAAVFDADGMVAIGVAGKRSAASTANIQKTDRFHLGSNTKAITATLAAILVDEGIVTWDTKYNFTGRHADYANVTLLDYLGHRGGLPANGTYPSQSDKLKDRRLTFSKDLLSKPAPETVGEFHYSNASYIVAASLLEQKSGRSYEDLLQDYLLDPLGMDSCGWGPSPDVMGHYYEQGTEPGDFGFVVNNGDNPPIMNSAGRLHCSLEDYGKFLREHLRGYQSALLPDNAYLTMHSPGADNYQAGWGIFERDWADGKVLTHTGSNTLNYAVTWAAPEADIAFVAVANATGNLLPVSGPLDQIISSLIGTYPK